MIDAYFVRSVQDHPTRPASEIESPSTDVEGGLLVADRIAESLGSRPIDVLIVEDDDHFRQALEISLGHMGFLTVSASSIHEARAILAGANVDVILCDMVLTDGTAMTLLPEVRNQPRRVPTILFSGTSLLIERPSLGDGFDRRFTKPLDLGHLQDAIHELCGAE